MSSARAAEFSLDGEPKGLVDLVKFVQTSPNPNDLLNQVRELIQVEYAKREILNQCTSLDLESSAREVAEKFVESIRTSSVSGVLGAVILEEDGQVTALMSIKPFKPLSVADIRRQGLHTGVTGNARLLMAELDEKMMSVCREKASHGDVQMKEFIGYMAEDERNIDNQHPRVIEFGRAISRSAGHAAQLGLYLGNLAWDRGARVGVGHVNDNGFRVSVTTPGSVLLTSLELRRSETVADIETNDPRAKAMNTPLTRGHRAKSNPGKAFYPTEFAFLYLLQTQLGKTANL